MRTIFISYRRSEAEYAAGALGRELRRRFGEKQVFRDKEDIGGGDRWKRRVLSEIDRDSALLVLIGSRWTEIRDAQGKRRLDDVNDPIRLEIADGIRDGATVIPILLENAEMPREDDLPDDVKPLAELNALKLRDGDWQHDLDRICNTLLGAGFGPLPPDVPRAAIMPGHPIPPQRASHWSAKTIAGAVLCALAFTGLFAEEMDQDGAIGVALAAAVALVLGLLGWRDASRGVAKGRVLAVIVVVLSAISVMAALGDLMPDEAETAGASEAPPQSTAVADVTPPQPTPTRAPAVKRAPRPDLSGTWTAPDEPTSIEFSQQGDTVSFLGLAANGVAFAGQGTLTGTRLEASVVNSDGTHVGEMRLTLSTDGRSLSGEFLLLGVELMNVQFVRRPDVAY